MIFLVGLLERESKTNCNIFASMCPLTMNFSQENFNKIKGAVKQETDIKFGPKESAKWTGSKIHIDILNIQSFIIFSKYYPTFIQNNISYYYQSMGNNQASQQGQFDPNAMKQYNDKFQNYRGQYSVHDQQNGMMPGAYQMSKPKTEIMAYSQLQRKLYIYKSSIDIEIKNVNGNNLLAVSFDYDNNTDSQCQIKINVGVEQIKQDEQTKQTTHIESKYEKISPAQNGHKLHFLNNFQIHQKELKQILGLGFLIRIYNPNNYEASEYSLKYFQNLKLWKVLMEIYFNPANQKSYELEDIFGGGGQNSGEEQQDCIICFVQKSTVMIKPCNHICLCTECSQSLQSHQMKNCPICRKNITGLISLQKK